MDVLAADLAVTALADRAPVKSDDAAVRLLESWAAEIDAHPVAVEVEALAPATVGRSSRGAARSVVAMTLALTLSSTGIATAVKGDPFAPIDYVVDKFDFGHHDRSSPVELFGWRDRPLGEPRSRDFRARAESESRPSRGPSDRPSRPAGADEQTAGTLVSHRLPKSAGAGEPQEQQQRDRQKLLVVQRPQDDTVQKPTPGGGGETPPNRPELPLSPTEPTWPKPTTEEPPPPPDEPTVLP